jgi:transcriptional regulator with XRE-family HTH domain
MPEALSWGQWVRRRARHLGISLGDLAARLGVDRRTIMRWLEREPWELKPPQRDALAPEQLSEGWRLSDPVDVHDASLTLAYAELERTSARAKEWAIDRAGSRALDAESLRREVVGIAQTIDGEALVHLHAQAKLLLRVYAAELERRDAAGSEAPALRIAAKPAPSATGKRIPLTKHIGTAADLKREEEERRRRDQEAQRDKGR